MQPSSRRTDHCGNLISWSISRSWNVTRATIAPVTMEWILITYRLPAEPSRHRVGVWRELRRIGAISLQQATWAVPARDHLVAGIERAAALVERAEGEALIFQAGPRGGGHAARLEGLFTEA